jgi:hypothetical protein
MPYTSTKRATATPNFPKTALPVRCDTSFVQGVSKTLLTSLGACAHGHSITGSFEQIQRLLPDFRGEQPQPGYMLDICKTCLQVLQERPYDSRRPAPRPRTSDETTASIIPAPSVPLTGL